MNLTNRIKIIPNICHGQACIVGTRITVHQILGMLAGGDSIESLLDAFPSIEKDDVFACLEYASILAEEETNSLELV